MKGTKFDRDHLRAQMQDTNELLVKEALARAPDEASRASIRSQAALMPAFDIVQVTLIGLHEAGRDDAFIGAVLGGLAGNILAALAVNAKNPETATQAFLTALIKAGTVEHGRVGFQVDIDRSEGVPS